VEQLTAEDERRREVARITVKREWDELVEAIQKEVPKEVLGSGEFWIKLVETLRDTERGTTWLSRWKTSLTEKS
jgi:hypothetical protein